MWRCSILVSRSQELRFQLQAFLLHPQPAAPDTMRALLHGTGAAAESVAYSCV